jgi:hypothetical protein
MSHTTSQVLRRRAHRLLTLANEIERSPVLRLDSFAGDDTWRGSRPQLCRNLLHANQAQLHSDADGLRSQAYLFEQQAEQLAAIEALQPGRAS